MQTDVSLSIGGWVLKTLALDSTSVWVLKTFLALEGILYLREDSLVLGL